MDSKLREDAENRMDSGMCTGPEGFECKHLCKHDPPMYADTRRPVYYSCDFKDPPVRYNAGMSVFYRLMDCPVRGVGR